MSQQVDVIQEKINKLLKKAEDERAKLKAAKAKMESSFRKEEESRKFKVGAYFLNKYRQLGQFDELRNLMEPYLINDRDRKLFELEPLNIPKEARKGARFDYHLLQMVFKEPGNNDEAVGSVADQSEILTEKTEVI